jgi:transcriptional regulator with XRE-family HTH domain
MKRKDLIKYIKEEIINELTPAEQNAKNIKRANATKDITNLTKKLSIEKDPKHKQEVQADLVVAKEKLAAANSMTEIYLDEMANIVSKIKVQDAAKFALAKEVYSSGRTGALLDALSTAGEEGMTQKELGAALGLKNDSELNAIITNLRMAGVLTPKRDKLVKLEKGAKEEEPEIEEPETDGDDWESSESEDDWENEPEEEETSEEEPEEEETPEEEPVATTKASDDLGKWVDELAKLNAKKDDLVKKLKAKEITMDQYKEMIGNIPTQIKALQAKIDRI